MTSNVDRPRRAGRRRDAVDGGARHDPPHDEGRTCDCHAAARRGPRRAQRRRRPARGAAAARQGAGRPARPSASAARWPRRGAPGRCAGSWSGSPRRSGRSSLPTLSEARRESLDHKLDLAGRPADLTRAALPRPQGGAVDPVRRRDAAALAGRRVAAARVPDGRRRPGSCRTTSLAAPGACARSAIERDLPDFLDILAVTVRAGLGYRAALLRVAESLGGPGRRGDADRAAPDGARRQPPRRRSWPCASATSPTR